MYFAIVTCILQAFICLNLCLLLECSTRNILDDFREAYYWLRQNTDDKARVMSWWDYGYQIAGMGNRTTLVDNNTWNNSHIALVSKELANERIVCKNNLFNDLSVDLVYQINIKL